MIDKMLEELIGFAKDEFGYELTIDTEATPQSFESIFGCSFLDKASAYSSPSSNCITEKFEYSNKSMGICLNNLEELIGYVTPQDAEMAA